MGEVDSIDYQKVGDYSAASTHSVLKVEVLEEGKMGNHKDMSDCGKCDG